MALLSAFLANWRHRMISPYIQGDVLDIGCGNAVVLSDYKDRINRYVGVEQSRDQVEKLSELFPDACFLNLDLEQDHFESKHSFDAILMIAVIEHIWNQKFLFDQVVRFLKPRGKIIITTPTPFGNDIIHPIGAAIGVFAQAAVEDHIVIYNRRWFKNLAREFSLTLKVYRRFQFFCNQIAILERAAEQ